MFLRFLLVKIKEYNQYKIEYFYSFLMLFVDVAAVPFMWYLITDGGSQALFGWEFKYLAVLPMVFGLAFAFAEIIGIFDVWYILSSSEGRKTIVTYFYKPVHPLIMIYGMHINPSSIMRLFAQILFLLAFMHVFNVSLSLGFVFLFACGVLVLINLLNYSVILLIAYERSAEFLSSIIWSMLRYADLPITHLKGFTAILTTIFPLVFIAALPSSALFIEPNIYEYAGAGIAVILTSIIYFVLWMHVKGRYEAVGG